MTLGWHILAEFSLCSKDKIDDLELVEKVLNESASIAGATIVQSVFHKFSPQGVSGVVVIEESHFAIHTWPEHGFAAVDLFTCSEKMDYQKAIDYLCEVFESKDYSFKVIERGKDIVGTKLELNHG